MKKLTVSLMTLAIAVASVSCKKNQTDSTVTTEQQEVATQSGTQYNADTENSVVKWNATHKGGLAPRYGTLSVENGSISVENGTVTGGEFVINLNSLKVDPASVTEADKKPEDLATHLKSPNFFDVEKYPTAKFEITSVTPFDPAKDESKLDGATNIVSGNLTLKDATINVTFPAKITINDTDIDFVANFTVDRTHWNLTYKSEVGDPKDWAISRDIDIALDVKAKK